MIGFQKKFSPLEQTLTASSKKYSWSGTWIKWQRGVVVRRSFQYQRHNGTDDERHEHVINRHSDVIWVIQGRYSDIACLPNHKIPNNCNDPWYVKACKHDRKKKIRFVSASALVQCLDDNKVRSLYQKLDSDSRQKAKGDKSLRSNLANIYQLVWIVFFLVQRTMNFCFILFALTPSPDHYRSLRKRFGLHTA